MNSWLTHLYDVVALSGSFLAIYVMQKTEGDKINMVDPLWLQWLRRGAFVLVSLALCYSVFSSVTGEWVPSLVVLLLVAAGVGNLLINAIALYLRSTPNGRRAVRVKPYAKGTVWR